MKKKPICLIDSGVGGFSILQKLQEQFPYEDFVYILDDKHFPYGNKTQEELDSVFLENLARARTFDPKIIILACNTLSSLYMNREKEEDDIFAIIHPTISYMNQYFDHKDILLLGTPFTIESSYYQKNLQANHLYSVSCEEFAGIVEDRLLKTPKSFKETRRVLKPYAKKKIDAVLCACTHFGFLRTEILELFPEAQIITNADAILDQIKGLLADRLYQKKNGKLMVCANMHPKDLKEKCEYFDIRYHQTCKL